MTRSFNEKIRCPNCQHEHTIETDFERWVRQSPELDSRTAGIVRFDLDVLLHKYLIEVDGKGSRDVQCLMFVEVKTFMAVPSKAQVDTLSMLNQVMRNRKQNIHSRPRRQANETPTKVMSKMLGREVAIKMYGGHLLQMDGTYPDNSSLMMWDNQTIDRDVLTDLLAFRLDPDRITQKVDHRRRSRNWTEQARLFNP